MSPIRQFLYVSRLVRDCSLQDVVRIISVSRRNNARDDLTGVLFFNGELFCQYLEGAADKLKARAAVILADSRHYDANVLHDSDAQTPRLFHDWRIGFAYNGGASLAKLAALRGDAALAEFQRIQAAAEFEFL